MKRKSHGVVNAGGTLLQVARPVAETYASISRRYGVTKREKGIMEGFKRAFSAPWLKTLRYQRDGRPFWRIIIAEATNCTEDDYFEEVYQYYAHGDAWCLPVGADTILRELKDAAGPYLSLLYPFHVIVVSSEVGYEKPAPEIFKKALGGASTNSRPSFTVEYVLDRFNRLCIRKVA